MSNEIASLIAKLSFKVDDTKLKEFENSMKLAAKKVEAVSKQVEKGLDKNIQTLDRRVQHTQKRLQETSRKTQQGIQKNNRSSMAGLAAIIKRTDKHRGQLYQTRKDYYRLNQEFKNGNISLEQRNVLLRKNLTKYRELQREAREYNRSIPKRTIHQNSPMGRATRTINAHANRVNSTFGGFGNSAMLGGAAGGGLARAFGLGPVGGAIAGGAAVVGGTAMAATASNRSYQEFIGARTALQGLTGSLEGANEKLLFLAQLSEFLGNRFMRTTQGYTQFTAAIQGTAMEGAAGDEAFAQMQAFFKSRDLGVGEQSQAIRAISQMLQKGQLYSEEVFGQLSETGIPAQMLVDALGLKNIAQLRAELEAGNVMAQDAIPKLAAEMERRAFEGGALESARNNTRSQQNRAANSAFYSNARVNMFGLDETMGRAYRAIAEAFQAAAPLFEEIAEYAKAAGPRVEATFNSLGNLLASIGRFSNSLDGVNLPNPFPSLAEMLDNLSDWIDKVTGIVEIIRSDDSGIEKAKDIGSAIGDMLIMIGENFINMIIDKYNAIPILPDMDRVSFERTSYGEVGNGVPINTNMSMMQPALYASLKAFEERAKVSADGRVLPTLNPYGGLTNPTDLPFGHPTDRQGNTITNHIDAPVSIQVDGTGLNAEEVGEAVRTQFEGGLAYIFKEASLNQVVSEK